VGACEDAAVTAHDGRVVKRLGDGMMAVFSDAESAVKAACEAREKVASVGADGYRPQLRAGIHLGRPRKIGGDYLGVDVNVAARVASAAKPGEILVSSAACQKLDESEFTLKKKRRFKAKGAPRELDVFAVEPATNAKI
jgi:adenylate cyclase